MRVVATMTFCALFGLVAEGQMSSVKIDGDALVRWPRDFSGVAVVPPEVRRIESDAFSGCSELTAVVLTGSLETIGTYAFSGCERLGEVRIPSSVTNIGRAAFFNCYALTNAVILARIRKLPGNIFSYCWSLSHVELPDGIIEVGDMAFRGCRSLKSIDIPGSVKRLEPLAFVGCSRLSVVELPEGVDVVDSSAFSGCYDLKLLVLHSVPAEIGVGAFRNCHNLRGCVLSGANGTNALYSVPSKCDILPENICSEERLVGKYETVKDALLAVDKTGKVEPDKGLLDGLEHTLRIAADGMIDELPDTFYPVGKIDALAANLFRLSTWDSAQTIKGFFKSYSSTSVDLGNKLVANFSIPGDIAITVESHDEKLTSITLSDGLKKVVRRRLKKENKVADKSVLKWLD